MAGYIGSNAGGVSIPPQRAIVTHSASSGQTVFSASYTVGYVDVFLNGVRLINGEDYVATSGSSVTFTTGVDAGSEVVIIAQDVYGAGNGVPASGGEFSGNVNVVGSLSSDGLTVDGAIKLNGDYPAGTSNTAIGASSLSDVTTGGYNTSIGSSSLQANTTASYNTAVGYQALHDNNTGARNTAVGHQALFSHNGTTGYNTAIGDVAMEGTTTGYSNVAVGSQSLRLNTAGVQNTAIGNLALYNSTTNYNVVLGYQAGFSQTTGERNTFLGFNAGYSVTTGSRNTFVGPNNSGYGAGYHVTTGTANVILGGHNGNQGGVDIRTSSNNIVLSDGDGNPRLHIDNTSTVQTGYYVIASGAQTVNALSSVTITMPFRTGSGILAITSEYAPNAAVNTRSVYHISQRYGDAEASIISSDTGPSGSTGFSITESTDGNNYMTITYINNNAGGANWIAWSFSGVKNA